MAIVTETDQILTTFCSEMLAAESLDRQEKALLRAIAHFRYNSFLFGILPTTPETASDNVRSLIFMSNFGEDWVAEYNENNFATDDEIIDHCLQFDEPILWSKSQKAAHTRQLPKRNRTVLDAAAAKGYTVGVSIPLRSHHNPFSYGISFAQRDVTDPTQHDKDFKKNQASIIAIARLFFSTVNFSERIRTEYELTPAEFEMAELKVRGKNASAIASLMREKGVYPSESTAKRAYKVLQDKLDAKSDAETIVKIGLMGIS